jgi:glycosyltransferase involved in cell wall biosynthesis
LNKKVLIIGYDIVDGNMGSMRLRRIARHLPEVGWDPWIITHTQGEEQDFWGAAGMRLYPVGAPDLTRLATRFRSRFPRTYFPPKGSLRPVSKEIRLTAWLNRWLMIPDKQIPWYRPGLRCGRQLLRETRFDLIFSSLGPRTTFLVASRLARECRIPSLLEYRDLWTDNPYYHVNQPTPVHRWIHRRMERACLRTASRISAVCRGIADQLENSYGETLRSRVGIHHNCFDPEEFLSLGARAATASAPFRVCYAGAMYANRSPENFFSGVASFIHSHRLTPRDFQFSWAGSVAGVPNLPRILEASGVSPFLNFLGQIPHRESLQLLQKSDVALLIQAPHDPVHIPGKLFEALGARTPLLALTQPCETAEIIQRCQAGLVCAHTAESVQDALTQFYSMKKSGQPWRFHEAQRDWFSAKQSVGRFARYCSEAAQAGAAR